MEGINNFQRPYIDPELEALIEKIYPARVCIDNDVSLDCTVVEVGSANKQGVLLDMVQILTDLDLVISKSYISSDGGWFMDVFHVTDQQGNKITDEGLIHYIQRALGATRRNLKEVVKSSPRPCHVLTKHTALEITGMDRQGLLSEVSAVLADLGCHITAAVAWTHSARTACIISLEDPFKGGITTDMPRLAHIKGRLQTVLEAHHRDGEKRCIRLLEPPVAGETHTERRLHQLMLADGDYEMCSSCGGSVDAEDIIRSNNSCGCAHVSIENCKEKGYSVVHLRCRDRPKLLFDTVCTLTDLDFVVFHAAINSMRSIAIQEYYIRHKDGCILNSEKERQRVIQCLVAAIERRDSDGIRLDITATDRTGLLSDVTRVFREHGLSVLRAEVGTEGKRAKGTFYITVTGAAGHNIDREVVEGLKRTIDGTVQVVESSSSSSSSSLVVDDHPKPFSLGSLLWSQIERLSSSLSPIKL